MSDDEFTQEQKDQVRECDSWVKTLLLRSGIRVVNFSKAADETEAYGLLNVPAKYVGIIDAMHQAIVAARLGQPLPAFVPLPVKAAKRRR